MINGSPLHEALEEVGLFNKTTLSMTEVGQESGQLGALLAVNADLLQEDIDHTLQRMTSLIEPLILGFMGLVVGAICIFMLQGMNQLTQAL